MDKQAGKDKSTVFNENVEKDQNYEMRLLEQYKLYVESANLTSRLRSQANSFFLTLNTVLVASTVGLLEFSAQKTAPLWIIFSCVVGFLLDLSWFFTIRSYRSLNSGRFAVIHELETELPARLYTREWEIVTHRRSHRSKYIRQTYVEQLVPIAFGILYIVFAVTYIIVQW